MFDIGRENEKFFRTREYVEGEDLKSHIRKRGKLSKEEAITLARQVGEGLAEAQKPRVVHRDFKSQNIMIGIEGRLSL